MKIVNLFLISLLWVSQGRAEQHAPANPASSSVSTRPLLLHAFADGGGSADLLVTGNPERHITFFKSPQGVRLRLERTQTSLGGIRTSVQMVGGAGAHVELVEHFLFVEQKLSPVPRIVAVNGKYIAGLDDSGAEMRRFLQKVAAEFDKTPSAFQTAVADFYRFCVNIEPRDLQTKDPSRDMLALLAVVPVQLEAFALLPLLDEGHGRGPKAHSVVLQAEPNEEVIEGFQRQFMR